MKRIVQQVEPEIKELSAKEGEDMTERTSQGCPKCGGKMDEGRVPKGLNLFSGYKSNSQKHFSFELNFQKARACLLRLRRALFGSFQAPQQTGRPREMTWDR